MGRASLRLKVMAAFLGIVMLLEITVLVFVYLRVSATLNQQLEDTGVAIARDVAARSASLVPTDSIFALNRLIDDTLANNPDVRYIIIIDANGNVLAHSFEHGVPHGLLEVNEPIPGERYSLAPLDTNEGRVLDIAVAISEGRWGMVRTGLTEVHVRDTLLATLGAILAVSAGLFILAAVGVYLFSNLLVIRPLDKLRQVTYEISQGNLSQRATVSSQDELGDLAHSLNRMADALQASHSHLEEQVRERTRDLEQRSAYLEASAEVGRAASSILDPDQLIRQATERISERFDLYYVGLFLVDEAGETAVLRAGTGSGGQALLARGHRLSVDERSMIGWSIVHGQPRIALVAEEDAVRLATPELPDTRSEAALPLRSRGQVIGALSVQSDQPGAFDEASLTVLQVMADQVAVALDNARLFQQAQDSLEAERQAYGEVSRRAWEQITRRQALRGYYAEPRGVFPATDSWQPEMARAVREGQIVRAEAGSGPAVAIPIVVRDQTVGVLDFVKENPTDGWTDQEIALLQGMVEQLGVALDSARLYQDTQRRAAQEQVLGQVTTRMRETLDVETVLQTAVDEIRQALRLDRAAVRLAMSETEGDLPDGGRER